MPIRHLAQRTLSSEISQEIQAQHCRVVPQGIEARRTTCKMQLAMFGLYAAGLYAICYNRISIEQVKKLTEIQTLYHSFSLRFDPNYQDYLLFSRMKRFDLSEQLIEEVRTEIETEKQRLIQEGGILPHTLKKIQEVEELRKARLG